MNNCALQAEYARLLIADNLDAADALERQHDLDGFPPELVSIGLRAIDNGHDPHEAIARAFGSAQEPQGAGLGSRQEG